MVLTGDDHARRAARAGQFDRYRRQPAGLLGRRLAVRALDVVRLPDSPLTDAERARTRPRASRSRCTCESRAESRADCTPSPSGRTERRPDKPARDFRVTWPGLSGRVQPHPLHRVERLASGPRSSCSTGSVRHELLLLARGLDPEPAGSVHGSGFPMRFAATARRSTSTRRRRSSPTSRARHPADVHRVLNNALGPRLLRRFTANMHTDSADHPAPTPSWRRHSPRRAGRVGRADARAGSTAATNSSFQGLSLGGGRLRSASPASPARAASRRWCPRARRRAS